MHVQTGQDRAICAFVVVGMTIFLPTEELSQRAHHQKMQLTLVVQTCLPPSEHGALTE
jgi:hypothetical protein|eukprot:COSAG03_NODE_91_length_13404_cov_69.155205_8_plen_58_part_00